MGCSICERLEKAYEGVLSEYVEARSSVRYRVSTVLAAQKNVDMERARYELEEHQRECAGSVVPPALIVNRDVPRKLGRIAA